MWKSGLMISLLTLHPIDSSSLFKYQQFPDIAHNIQKMYYAKHMNMMKKFKNDRIESGSSSFL